MRFKRLLFLVFLEPEIDPRIFPYQAETNADLLYMQKMHLISQNSKNDTLGQKAKQKIETLRFKPFNSKGIARLIKYRLSSWISHEQTILLSVSLLTISSTFHSLFRVLCIFPSRYLFAIGLSPVFSFRWNLPPILGCILKQPDSSKTHHVSHIGNDDQKKRSVMNGIITLLDTLFQRIYTEVHVYDESLKDYNSKNSLKRFRFSAWAFPASLAVTKGILVSFFSSTY